MKCLNEFIFTLPLGPEGECFKRVSEQCIMRGRLGRVAGRSGG